MCLSDSVRMLCRAWLAAAICAAAIADASAETPAQLLAGYTVQSGVGAVPSRGQQFFTSRHGRDWSCATCHGSTPTGAGRHVVTGKAIEPLAPAFNPARFSDGARTEKWFRRNCKDVVGRECSAIEKADVLSWLMSLKP
ncbi:DUF1924 domain-containing protein [Burkholderia sp. AU42008]|nr:DUF1924 domain-containing protein [Burkholderia sp. AU32357]MBY4871847.1 DUF1924 domain-containing protein [Burkholderia sp. AU42008]OXI37928.1 cytochrome C [Burkholderia sp. AU17457]RQU18087.1 DUF1924 domain-containing protein [Burkholderia cenocepacia]RQU26890.1 DUF1924 domain-containing protein [Burkholderia cenocepacia]